MTVRVNGTEIPEEVIGTEVQYHPASSFDQARDEAARALVIRELLLQEAARRGITEPDPDGAPEGEEETRDAALIRTLIALEVKVPEADEESCRRYYQANRKRFRSADLYEGSHILFAADPEDEKARAEAKEKAERVLEQVLREPDAFARLARQFSDCPSGKQGGNLGQLTRGSTVPEFETFLFNLEPGQTCPIPVQSRYGWHIARLEQRVEGKELPFDLVKDRIAGYLAARVWQRAVAQYISLLVGQARIEGVEIAGANSPLVQ